MRVGALLNASRPRSAAVLVACAAALARGAPLAAGAAERTRQGAGALQLDAATLEQCVVAVTQSERAATFAG
jgi:hypothetical protein